MARNRVSYVSGVSDTPLLGMTIGDMFDQIVAEYPDHEALIVRHQGLRYTYRQLQREVERCARGLMALGLEKGERIGIWSPNRAEWTITQLATSKIGAILVNINPAYRVHELLTRHAQGKRRGQAGEGSPAGASPVPGPPGVQEDGR